LRVIDGTDEDKYNSSQVFGIIQLHLSDAYLSMADDVATGKALWDKLEATFTAQNNARRLLLRQELNSLRKGPTEPISEYVARAKELATNLEAVGHKPDPSEVTLSVLAGLPKEYSVLVTVMGTLKRRRLWMRFYLHCCRQSSKPGSNSCKKRTCSLYMALLLVPKAVNIARSQAT